VNWAVDNKKIIVISTTKHSWSIIGRGLGDRYILRNPLAGRSSIPAGRGTGNPGEYWLTAAECQKQFCYLAIEM
jgi:hypothetical protein